MKRFLFISLGILVSLASLAQTPYSRVKLYADRQQLLELAANGLNFEGVEMKADEYAICELSQQELSRLEAMGVEYEVLIADMASYYRERNEPFLSRLDEIKSMDYALNFQWPVPDGFELGTCGGFLTIDQCMEHLDNMAAQYPNLISGKDRSGIVALYYLPTLFYSRMPVKATAGETIKDTKFDYTVGNEGGITVVAPAKPTSLFQFRRKLQAKGFSRFLIDLSSHKTSQNTLKRLLRNFENEKSEQPSSTFNFKKGLT